MLRITVRSLWTQRLYALLILLVLITSGGGWGVLSSTLQTTQYVVNANLDLYWRTTYDLLVRPKGTLSELEERYGLVEPNYLSNTYTGGITRQQYEAIKRIPGVEVAAPVAPVGFVFGGSPYIRVRLPGVPMSWRPESGTPPPDTIYGLYRLQVQFFVNNGVQTFQVGNEERYVVNLPFDLIDRRPYIQSANFRVLYTSSFEFVSRSGWQLIIPIVGIAPEEEARLLNLDASITSGRYLRPDDRPQEEEFSIPGPTGKKIKVPSPTGDNKITIVPVLVNGAPYINAYTQVRLEKYNLPEGFDPLSIPSEPSDRLVDFLQSVTSTLLLDDTFSPQTAVQAFLGSSTPDSIGQYWIDGGWMFFQGLHLRIPSSVSYRPLPKPEVPAPFVLEALPQGKTDYGEMTFRQSTELEPESLQCQIRWEQVGVYDPARLGVNPTGLVDVPLEVYYPPYALLKYGPDGTPHAPQLIRPTMNAPVNYLLPPPYALVTLDTARWLTGREDFISAIRVRVTGTEERHVKSQALVEAVAAEIERQTGLHVDITLGSSLNRTLVYVPGYADVPPLGYVEEGWVVKGANLAIAQRVNWANLVLSLTALFTCFSAIAILMANSTLARTRQWSLLHALGWRPSAISAAVLLEVGLLGGLGGLLAAGAAWLLSSWLHLSFTWWQLLSVPLVTFLLSLLASFYALRQVDAIRPVTALRQGTVTPARWRVGLSSLWALSLRGLTERRGLAVLGFLMLSATTALLVMLLGIGNDLERFLGTTRLGEHLLGLAGWYYYLLLAVCLIIAGVAIADMILSEVRRRRAEIGVFLATGWRKAHVLWVFVGQAALLGMAGGLCGSLLGSGLLRILAGERSVGWPQAAGAGVVFALLVGLLAALYPAWRATHVPPAEAVRYE
jgi:hypothetical protein